MTAPIIETRTIAAIPCLVAQPASTAADTPTVILYHGWGSIKEHYRFFASMLASFGYRAIVPDAPMHGERGSLPSYHSAAGYKHWWDVIIEGVEESGDLLDGLVQEGLAARDRIALVGSSMGGFLSSGVFAAHEELKVFIGLNTCCAWEAGEQAFRKLAGRVPATEEELNPLRAYDPLQKKERLAPRPMLLVHGDQDNSVPIDGQRAFYKAMVPMYADAPERLWFEVFPRVNHSITLGMLEGLVDWLNEYL